jgi:photosystem II stability/assembly factor-like uncharacterized protein
MRFFYPFLMMMAFIGGIQAQHPLRIPFGDLRARDIGPAVMSGRISSLDAVQRDPHILYVGAASGGVWKSTSAGATFQPVFDEHNPSIGDICIDQQHPDTVWVGTGESWVRNSVSPGDGIYVTTNGGKTWTHKGLKESRHIAKVLVDPRDPATVWVAVQGALWGDSEERGVYKSTDFGATWQKVLFVNDRTGCADLTMDPRNPDVLYAGMWEHRREAHFFTSGGPGSGLYKTTDGGKTWRLLEGGGLPERPYGRIAVEVAPSAPDTVYATIEAAKKEEKGLYRSYDAGNTWTRVSTDFNVTVRPFYFSRLTIDPRDPMKVYKCGLNLIVSDDGGVGFRSVGSGVHSDIHDVWVNPGNGRHVLIGTDGGVYESYDGAYNFRMYMNLPVSQFYHVSVDDAEPFHVYGGLQDNGTWKGPSSAPGGIANSDWHFLLGGDGFHAYRHRADQEVVYGESQGGNLSRIELASGQSKLIKPMPAEGEPPYRFNWNSPIALSPSHPERIYYGAQFLFRSEDRGNSWTRISPDLTTNRPERQRQKESGGLSPDNSTAENNTTIVCIAESPRDARIIWAGTDDGLLQVTADGGATWTNAASRIEGLPPFTWCTSVEASPFDARTAFVTFDGHTQGDDSRYVFRTTDLGQSWTSLVTEELEGFVWVIRQDVVNPELLFLGTESGLFISLDGGISWQRFSNNFPKVPVRALDIQPRDHALAIATHGRGIYLIDDLRPLRQLTAGTAEKEVHFLETGKTLIRLPRGGGWFGGAGNYVAANPSGNARITYYMKKRHTFGRMYIEVLDGQGNLIQELPAGKSAGINIVELPVRYPMPKAAPSSNRMALFGSIVTPSLSEGQYTVRIVKGKEQYETVMELEEEAARYYSAEDRRLQSGTLRQLYDQTERLGYLYFAAGDLLAWADSMAGQGQRKADQKAVRDLATGLRQWRDTLVALGGDGFVAEEEALREEISTLYLSISGYPGRPSDHQLRTTARLDAKLKDNEDVFARYRQRADTLATRLGRQGVPMPAVRTWEDFRKG